MGRLLIWLEGLNKTQTPSQPAFSAMGYVLLATVCTALTLNRRSFLQLTPPSYTKPIAVLKRALLNYGMINLYCGRKKITLQTTQSLCNVLNVNQLMLIKMVRKKVNKIIFVSVVADNL